MVSSKEYLMFDIKERKSRKRASDKTSQLRWSCMLDQEDNRALVALARGFNHCNKEQSREGKPTLHFKVVGGK